MSLSQSDVVDFINDVNKLSRRERPRFVEDIYAKLHSFGADHTVRSSHEAYREWDLHVRPLAAAWHWIWCIASQATVAKLEDITPEIWAEARTMLDEALANQEATKINARIAHNNGKK